MSTFLTTQKYINAYNSTSITENKIPEKYNFNVSFLRNPTVEISGNSKDNFLVEFIDGDRLVHSSNIRCGMWTKVNREYYADWRVRITKKDQVVYDQKIDFTGKKVYISLESKALGDTLAWFPYAEEFRKKHSCQVAISTFMNDLFIDQYPDLEFVSPGQGFENIYAHYKIGWFYNNGLFNQNLNPKDFKKIPLQQTASDILGLDYKEVSANLPNISTTKKKRVGFAMHSTAQAKYWNNPTGWQEVVNYLIKKGYEVVLYSRENDGYMGNFQPKGIQKFPGGSMKDVISDMSTCEFFIGLASGLSWLAWSIGLPVVLISGFSEEWAETLLNTYRVINKSVCHGCFNSDRLDAGDWNWCPKHKNTERMFECTKKIGSDMVIKQINKIINGEVEENDYQNFDWGKKDNQYVDAAIKEVFEDNTYERFFEVEEGDIVVDLGASIGPFTYKILPKNPKQCYVVEPLSHQIDILNKNVGKDNVKIIQGAITDKKKIEISWDNVTESVPTFTFREFLDENGIDKIDFLKCDCEGGEYDVFQPSNIEFLKTIPKIVTEFHLRDNETFDKCKFRWFRKNILPKFNNIQVYSFDGVDIKWDLWNEHFIEYYCEVIIYIDNR
jgi:autotransporter strand-loop-strand O-heptosyltransferase